MGCKQSKQHYEIPAVKTTEPKATLEGIECATGDTDGDTSVLAEETPHDIRKIRAELFSKDSVLAVTSSSSVLTRATTFSYGSSYGSSDTSYLGASGSFCSFGSEGEQDHDNFHNEEDFDDYESQQASLNSNYSHSRKSHNNDNRYHYPATLYQELKSVKHFVPSSANHMHHRRDISSLPTIQSGLTGEESDEGTESRINTPGGESYGGDMALGVNQLFPQFDALVDTMELSLEPHRHNMESRPRPALSFGALLDKLTELEDGDDAFITTKDDNETDYEVMKQIFPNGSITKRSGNVPPFKYNARFRKARNHRHSAPPMLEQKHSSELLADMKSLAMMADVLEKTTPQDNSGNQELDCNEATEVATYCSTTKYHRSHSFVPANSDALSVCSDLGRWM